MRMIFVPSPGNWGDSLINAGTREFLAAHSFKYSEVRRSDVLQFPNLDACHIVVGGGGGWCRFWHSTPEFVNSLLQECGHVTVLPTSFADAPIVPPNGPKLTLYSRGRTGLESPSLNFRLCHDMAFYCSDQTNSSPDLNDTLNAFREDSESALGKPAEHNYDISLQGDGFTDPRPFYHKISQYSRVRTDRLHVGIAAAQLGLRVDLFPSGYPKVEGVYFHSIEGLFPAVVSNFRLT